MDMSVWFLVGAILVFFMQCGFAMVETGFTRAKNAGNIIMKNLMDFCIGTVVFVLLGYGIMNSENYFFGLIGMPEYQMFTSFYDFDWSNFFFQLVFCATAATIVSGAMAERTKFLAYCVYSGFISAIVYPIEAGWVWNSQGWLVQLGYVDFAGSSVIHMVGGLSALLGAWMLGPRLGKYSKEKNGKIQVNAIPGHSLTLGALGCFILVLLVRLQRCGGVRCDADGPDPGHHDHRARGGHRVLHGIYLDSERKAGRVHVPERLSGRAGGDYRPLCLGGRGGGRRHRRGVRRPCGRRGGIH